MTHLFPQSEGVGSGGAVDPALVIERKTDFILNKRAEDTIAKITTGIAIAQDSRVSRSHLIRAVCILLEHADESIVEEARAINLGRRPPNGAHEARHRYETQLATAISRALTLRGPLGAADGK